MRAALVYELTTSNAWVGFVTLAAQLTFVALLPLATAHGFPLWSGCGTFWQGWVVAMQHHYALGLAQMRQGLQAMIISGQTVSRRSACSSVPKWQVRTGRARKVCVCWPKR